MQPVYSPSWESQTSATLWCCRIFVYFGLCSFLCFFCPTESLILPPGQAHLTLDISPGEWGPSRSASIAGQACPALPGAAEGGPSVRPLVVFWLLMRRPGPLWLLFHLVLKTIHVMVEKTQAQRNKVTSSQATGSKQVELGLKPRFLHTFLLVFFPIYHSKDVWVRKSVSFWCCYISFEQVLFCGEMNWIYLPKSAFLKNT